MWSAGCTLYEILTGDYLFYDVDWIRFFLRVTTPNTQEQYAKDSETFRDLPAIAFLKRGIRLIPQKRAMLGNNTYLIDLLEFLLVQDPSVRPTVQECKLMAQHVLSKFQEPQPFDFSILGSL